MLQRFFEHGAMDGREGLDVSLLANQATGLGQKEVCGNASFEGLDHGRNDIDAWRRLGRKGRGLDERSTPERALGDPLAPPAQLAGRFDHDSVRDSVRAAFEQASVVGRLEDLDCSEYPCIAFGRLRGDEEDMERVERARALHPYRDDVLTLLFWARSDESASREHPRETGLFALAFYPATEADRADSVSGPE